EIIAFVDRELHACSVESVLLVRSPRLLFKALTERGFPVARCDPPAGIRALLKPLRSGGGIGIRFHDGKAFDRGRFYTQEFLEGEPTSLVFLVGRIDRWCVGGSRQLVGADWLHCSEPFGYCGSICTIPEHRTELGSALGDLGLRGLVGVDGIECDGVFRIVEVNPRYTASVEILERASGRKLLREHFEYITHRSCPIDSRCGLSFTGHPGKAILYAPVDFTFPAIGPWNDDYPFASVRRRFADLPHRGQAIRRGQPVLTFFADGDSPMSTEAALRKIAGDLDRLLFGR
ncbi:MAG TPA: ATP-grasp domain-containing protein, partial [Gemmataceae bacterium]|nr:ATP-grasp domain-containing protein [Gemmataceae bacterium]